MAFIGQSLPEDLAREILLKLRSTKSAVRLSCVCKLWCDLITKDPDFRDNLSDHIIKSGRKIKNDDPLMVLYKSSLNKEYYYGRHDTRKFVHLDFPKDLCLKLVGSCNGLVCFHEGADSPELHVHLYNPITREHRKLPPSSIPNRLHYGFGFDSCSNDYKVISIVNANKAEMYKLSTNCWSDLNVGSGLSHNPGAKLSARCVYVNGYGYWSLYEGSQRRILTFDFGTEKFDSINLPMEAQAGAKHNISVLDDSIAVCLTKFNYFRFPSAFEVWQLSKNSNDEHSFTKKFCIKGAINMLSKVVDSSGRGGCWVDDTCLWERKVPNGYFMSLVIKENEKAGMLILIHSCFTPPLVFKPSLVAPW